MTYPIITMIVGAAIFGAGLFCKIWPQTTESAATAETNGTSQPEQPQTGGSFMRIGQGAVVDGFAVRRAEIHGVNTVFDVSGKLTNTELEDFKSYSDGPNKGARIAEMKIGRVEFRPPPKMGVVQASLPTNTRKPDGTVLSEISFKIDAGVTADLVIGMKDGGLIDYEFFQNGRLVPTQYADQDGYIIRKLDKANGTYVAKVHRTNDIETLNIGIQQPNKH